MVKVTGLKKKEASIWLRPLFFGYKRVVGKVTEPFRVMARRPSIAWFSNLLGMMIERSGRVEPRLHVLTQTVAARMVGCPF